ncbi:MAG: RNA-binding S4 domain-containing protein [Francisellaceae bacterium]
MDNDIRLDKWLWAARFFKTRAIAKEAIEGGKVHYNGSRSKVSKKVEIGAKLSIRQGLDVKEITVIALADKRGAASVAQMLYEESSESIKRRELESAARKLNPSGSWTSDKPNKKQRRQIIAFKSKSS